MKKKSFFEKLTGGVTNFGTDTEFEKEIEQGDFYDNSEEDIFEEDVVQDELIEEEVGELSVDMYRTNDAIIIKTMVAGIQKSEIDITLTRDMIRIEGSRFAQPEGTINEAYFQELYWGAFERTVQLPEEIDIEMAEAHESHGLLTLILPLIDKNRQARIKVK